MDSQRVALYRHFNHDGDLLYVGISLSAAERLRQHVDGSCWRYEIARMEISWFESRQEALAAEKEAIKSEAPIFNRTHSARVKRAVPSDAEMVANSHVAKNSNARNADEQTMKLCESEADAIAVSIHLSGRKQSEIASLMGISEAYLSHLKRGHRSLTARMLIRFTEATGWNLVRQYRDLQSALRAAQGRPREMDRIAYIASFSEAA